MESVDGRHKLGNTVGAIVVGTPKTKKAQTDDSTDYRPKSEGASAMTMSLVALRSSPYVDRVRGVTLPNRLPCYYPRRADIGGG